MGVLTGFARADVKAPGGILNVYMGYFSDMSGMTATGLTLGFHCAAGKLKHFELPKDAGSVFTSVLTGNLQTGANSYVETLVAKFHRNQSAKRTEFQLLADHEIVYIVEDRDFGTGTTGNLFAVGFKPVSHNDLGGVDATTGTMSSGANLTDGNQMDITLTSNVTHPPYLISASDYAKVVAGSSV